MGNKTSIQPIEKPIEKPIVNPPIAIKINKVEPVITPIPRPGEMREIERSRMRKVQTIPLNDSETIPRMPRHKEQANNKILEHQYFTTSVNNDIIPEKIETRGNTEETLWKFKKEMDYRLGISNEPRQQIDIIRNTLDNEDYGSTEIVGYSENSNIEKGYMIESSPMSSIVVNQANNQIRNEEHRPNLFMEPEKIRQVYDPLELLKYEKLGKYTSYFDIYNKLLGLYNNLLIIQGNNHPSSLIIINTIEWLKALPYSQTQLILVMGSLKKCYN
jgi:hypothetical protein